MIYNLIFLLIEQKDTTFDHYFGYSFPFFSSLLKTEWRRKGEWIAKIVIKSHAFLLDKFSIRLFIIRTMVFLIEHSWKNIQI